MKTQDSETQKCPYCGETIMVGVIVCKFCKHVLSLGKQPPPVKEKFKAPTSKEIAALIAEWDEFAPEEYRGLLSAKPLGWTGTPKPLFYYDEGRRVSIRASNGQVITTDEKRRAWLAFQDAKNKK